MKELDFLNELYIAHRGLHDIEKGIPENSMLAFRKAINKKVAIELDVHLTLDNKIVVFHDYTLKRICNVNKSIEQCTYKELLKYNLFNTKCKIPLLENVLDLINGKVFLIIETKVLRFDGKLEEKLAKILDNYSGNFAIQSFNVFSINWFRKNRKEYIRGLLSSDFRKRKMNNLERIIAKTLLCDVFLKCDFISYDIRAIDNLYIKSRRKRKKVLSWTVNKSNLEKAKEFSDGYIFEKIDI